MILIDTHTHLYLHEFKDDLEGVLQRATSAGVDKFFLPAIDSTVIDDMLSLEKKYPDTCMAMMGLHPCSVKGNFKEELDIVEEWLAKRKFAAIGEIGIDLYWDDTFKGQQYEAFRRQIELSLQYNLPVVIHTRNAMKETIAVVEEYVPRGVWGIFHCFSGDKEDAAAIIEAGCYLGIGGVVTYKNTGLAEVLKDIDLKYMVLETDSPYLTPVPFRGKRNESSYLKHIAEKLASIKNIDVAEVAAITTANAEKIFDL